MGVWRQPLDGQRAVRLGVLDDGMPWLNREIARVFSVSPDGQRIVYRCRLDLCIADISGSNTIHLMLDDPASRESRQYAVPIHLAWSEDSAQVALTRAGAYGRGPELWIVARAGDVQRQVAIGPGGSTDVPQWTPDGRFLFLTMFPFGGRRIVAVETTTGQVTDLSQPRWDAFASLTPDGTRLMLWNGRGSFWTVPIETTLLH